MTAPSGMKQLDNSNLSAIIADATGEVIETPTESTTNENGSQSASSMETPDEKVLKSDTKDDKTAQPAKDADSEDEDGVPSKLKGSPEFTESVKRTIGKKHRQAREAEEFAQDQYNQRILAERRAAELERQLRLGQVREEPAQQTQSNAPDRKNFATDEEYQAAVIDYRVDQRWQAHQQAIYEQQMADAQNQARQQAESRIAAARTIVPDFDEVVSAADMNVPQAVATYMQDSPLFAELGYHLAKHPEVLQSLSQMPPMKQLVEIGKIEAIIKPFEQSKASNGHAPSPDAGKPATNGKARDKAPTPITPINTASGLQVQKDEADMSYQEAKALWAKNNRANLGKRARH